VPPSLTGRIVARALARVEIALKLAEEGMAIAVHYRSDAGSAELTAKLVRQRGAEAVVVLGDVCDPEQLRALIAAAGDGLGGLGVD
jgi:3-oxoacyl-[acyl-carrier protein] reductase